MTWFSAVKAAVAAADYEELALSYPEDKIKDRLEQYGDKMSERMNMPDTLLLLWIPASSLPKLRKSRCRRCLYS